MPLVDPELPVLCESWLGSQALVGRDGTPPQRRSFWSTQLITWHFQETWRTILQNKNYLQLEFCRWLFGKVDTQDSVQAVVWVKTTEFANMSGPKVKLMVCSRKKQDNNNSSLQPTQLNVGQWQLVRMSSHLLSRSRHCNSLYYCAMRYQQKKGFEIWQKHSLGFK